MDRIPHWSHNLQTCNYFVYTTSCGHHITLGHSGSRCYTTSGRYTWVYILLTGVIHRIYASLYVEWKPISYAKLTILFSTPKYRPISLAFVPKRWSSAPPGSDFASRLRPVPTGRTNGPRWMIQGSIQTAINRTLVIVGILRRTVY